MGEFRAPKSRDSLREYYWFCLDHVRAYNASWDYYAGMTTAQIEGLIRQDVTWRRPTWPLGRLGGGGLRFGATPVRDFFNLFDEEEEKRQNQPPVPNPAKDALQVMELTWPVTLESLKARYKELCKIHHPDTNGGDKASEERFKRIGQAYRTLMESLGT